MVTTNSSIGFKFRVRISSVKMRKLLFKDKIKLGETSNAART